MTLSDNDLDPRIVLTGSTRTHIAVTKLNGERIKQLMVEFNECCHYCERRVFLEHHDSKHLASRDHKFPKARSGRLRPRDTTDGANLVLACRRCNTAKADLTDTEFLHLLETGKVPASYLEWIAEKTLRQMNRWPFRKPMLVNDGQPTAPRAVTIRAKVT